MKRGKSSNRWQQVTCAKRQSNRLKLRKARACGYAWLKAVRRRNCAAPRNSNPMLLLPCPFYRVSVSLLSTPSRKCSGDSSRLDNIVNQHNRALLSPPSRPGVQTSFRHSEAAAVTVDSATNVRMLVRLHLVSLDPFGRRHAIHLRCILSLRSALTGEYEKCCKGSQEHVRDGTYKRPHARGGPSSPAALCVT